MNGPELRAIFGGRWDGGGREIHGLLEVDGQPLKIELLRSQQWVCSVFVDGDCAVVARADTAEAAVAEALTQVAR